MGWGGCLSKVAYPRSVCKSFPVHFFSAFFNPPSSMEIHKGCLSGETIETNDDYSLLLELPESDPFFETKKKLLQVKGLGPKEFVCFRSSLCPNYLNDVLEKMLQRARIIQLSETELYFDRVDGPTLIDYYGPRNELEALNSILSLINISISSRTHMTTKVLEDLRDVTVNMIRDFGNEKEVETKIVENCSCDKEKSLLQWGENNGVRTKLQIAHVEGAGRGAIAIENLKVGDTALEVPVSIIISEELVHESDMFHILEKIDVISSETMLLLWSMREKHNRNSKFRLYFDSLPAEFNTGLSFGMDAIVALDGTLLFEEIMQAKEHLRTQYAGLFPALCNDHPDIFPPEMYTWEQFLWACELWYSNGMKIMFTDGKLKTCLIPIAGFLNHSLCPHIMHYGKVDSTTHSLRFPLSRPCSAGEQCYLSYGNFSSYHFVTFYGFLPQGDNLYDVIPLDIGADADKDDSSEGGSQINWTSHMVRGTWLSKNHEIFYYGLPLPLLDYFRRYRGPLHNKTLTQENLEIEIEVLRDLQSTFEDMMETLDDTKSEDRKSSSWDMKLAVECKDIQRRIVSSITTSCFAGIRLVENELKKFMTNDSRG